MNVFAVFEKYKIEDWYDADHLVSIHETEQGAEQKIEKLCFNSRIEILRSQKLYSIHAEYKEIEPDVEDPRYSKEGRPIYNHNLRDDKDYNREHEKAVAEWRLEVQYPKMKIFNEYLARQRAYYEKRSVEIKAINFLDKKYEKELAKIETVNPYYIQIIEIEN